MRTAAEERSSPLALEPTDWAAIWGLVLVQVLFGALSVAGKIAFTGFPPLALAALRVSTAAVILWFLHAIMVRERVAPRHLPKLALYSLFGIVGNQILFMMGLERTDPVAATVLVTTIPVFTLLVAVLFRVESLGWRKIVGIVLAFVGVVVLVGASRGDFGSGKALGNLLVALNALSYAIYLVIARDVLRIYRPMTVAAWTFTFGALVIVLVGLPDLMAVEWGNVPTRAWIAFAYVVLGATVATYVLNNWALTRVASSTVALYVYLQPVVAALLAYIVFATLPTTRTLVGALFIFAGVWFAAAAKKRLSSFGRVRA